MPISKEKAKEILRHGEVRGHKLTEKQRGFFGARAGGQRYPGAKSPMDICAESKVYDMPHKMKG